MWSFLAASGMAAVFFAFAVVGALMRPFRLWERGVEFRRRFRPTLWRYSDIRDVQLLRNDRGRPTYVRITRVDGTLTTIGSPRVSEADFVSFELERVFGLLDQAVREQGAHAQARWSPEVWASVEPLIFRGSIIARLERAARANGTQLIDTKFVRAATAADPELARWLSLAAVTHAWQEKRKRERPPSRT